MELTMIVLMGVFYLFFLVPQWIEEIISAQTLSQVLSYSTLMIVTVLGYSLVVVAYFTQGATQ